MTTGDDWRSSLLADLPLPDPLAGGRDPLAFAGYEPRQAVRLAEGRVAGHEVVACVWDFATYGGTIGELEASTVADAAARAAQTRRPLVSFVRTGGTRMQEGMAALVGIPRTSLALHDLGDAGVPHLAVADHPTTGGVWVSVVSGADLRVGVAGATVGFSGPRVIEAMTGETPARGSHTAESAHAAGLLDAVVEPDGIGPWLARALDALRPHDVRSVPPYDEQVVPARTGMEQVRVARDPSRQGGAVLLGMLLDEAVRLGAADDTVQAVVGRSAAGRATVAVALAAHRGGRPTPAGYAVLTRSARLADRLQLDLLTLIDTPGADPRTASEAAGVAPAIGTAMTAVLTCRSPTLVIVHGEGGSGGALAGATTDAVLVTAEGYFTALAPEGAATALHTTAEDAADRMALTPADLRRLGFADGYAPSDPAQLRSAVATHLAALGAEEDARRLQRRQARWRGPLPGRCDR